MPNKDIQELVSIFSESETSSQKKDRLKELIIKKSYKTKEQVDTFVDQCNDINDKDFVKIIEGLNYSRSDAEKFIKLKRERMLDNFKNTLKQAFAYETLLDKPLEHYHEIVSSGLDKSILKLDKPEIELLIELAITDGNQENMRYMYESASDLSNYMKVEQLFGIMEVFVDEFSLDDSYTYIALGLKSEKSLSPVIQRFKTNLRECDSMEEAFKSVKKRLGVISEDVFKHMIKLKATPVFLQPMMYGKGFIQRMSDDIVSMVFQSMGKKDKKQWLKNGSKLVSKETLAFVIDSDTSLELTEIEKLISLSSLESYSKRVFETRNGFRPLKLDRLEDGDVSLRSNVFDNGNTGSVKISLETPDESISKRKNIFL